MEINLPNGANVEEIVLPDGSNASEVIGPDGSTVWESGAIPDSGLLHAHYDSTKLSVSDNDSVTTWQDETSNGFDLTNSNDAPIFKSDTIGGNPVVRFDGTDDNLAANFDLISQPDHIFVVCQYRGFGTSGNYLYDGWNGGDSTANRQFTRADGGDDLEFWAGDNFISAGTPDTNEHIFAQLYDGSESTFRIDGSEEASGDVGSNDLDGIVFGSVFSEGNWGEVDIGEVLIYDGKPNANNVEQYLSDKWGIALS